MSAGSRGAREVNESPVDHLPYRPGGPIVLAPYDSAWTMEFAREASRIAAVLGDRLRVLHHVGSTAVPGLAAKPVIDMLAVVAEIDVLDRSPDCLAELGYEALGEFGIPGRRYFRKTAAGVRTHQIHAFGEGATEIGRMLGFRDYLRAQPAAAGEYEALKRTLAQQLGSDVEAYADGKSSFVRDILTRSADGRR